MPDMDYFNGQYTGEQIDQDIGIALKIESDLASIHATGSNNTTGAPIQAGTYFYLNGVLVRATKYIGINADFTPTTNYAAVTDGGLNEVKAAMDVVSPYNVTVTPKTNVTINSTQFARSGHLVNYLVSFTTSVNMSLYDNLFTLSVKPKTYQGVELMTGIYIPSGKGIFIGTDGIAIVGNNTLPAGTYTAAGMYLAD